MGGDNITDKSKIPKIKRLIKLMRTKFHLIVTKYKSPYTRREKISFLDLIIFSVLLYGILRWVYKKGYEFLIEELGLFPKIRYNKLVERLSRYEELLFEIQRVFLNKKLFVIYRYNSN